MKNKIIKIGLMIIVMVICICAEIPVQAFSVPYNYETYELNLKMNILNFLNSVTYNYETYEPPVSNGGNSIRGIISTILLLVVFIIIITELVRFIIAIKNIEKSKLSEEIKKKEKKKTSRKLIILTVVSAIGAKILYIYILATSQSFDKPIIYLYPKKKQKVTVKVERKDKLTCTYPKYVDSWEVMAEPNGELVDLKTGRNLYGLYYESNKMQLSKSEEGFCIKGEDTIKFLEEKLAKLGLTQREANEFIIYWLPKLEKNPYNLIRFQEVDLINENMPIDIYPKPDTFIRIIMEYKPLNKYVEIKEQNLTTPKRERICCC